MEKGYIQIYTGNGKGKTTAAFGVALRAIGAGYKVYIGQFMKNGDYSEIAAFQQFDAEQIKIEQYGAGGELSHQDKQAYAEAAEVGLSKARAALQSHVYDVVILDEMNVALHMGYVQLAEVLDVIAQKPVETELIITGRYAAPEVMEKADLITEMKEIRHYYKEGVPARKGIEK